MEKAAKKLNLKAHLAGFQNPTMLVMPIDIEGHIGKDTRMYVLDFARTFPPTAPTGKKGCILYNLFRPEFVGKYSKPLSSDSFSR